MIDIDFLPTFLDESTETLERWEAACMKLETASSVDILNELFRSAHNMKGSSRSIGLNELARLVHKAEDVITKLKNGDLLVSSQVISVLLECQKTLVDWVEGLRTDPEFSPDIDDVITQLSVFLPQHSADIPKSIGFGFFDDEASAAELTKNDNASVSQETKGPAPEAQRVAAYKPDETIRVSLRKLDSVIRLIGELSIHQSIVRNASGMGKAYEKTAVDALNLSSKILQDLHSEAMSLRMQPLENLFQRMERVCRDVARQQQKALNVILKGTDVEMDRTVIERMKDPLIHILRNAVDHGVEDNAARASAGKPGTANVTIEGIQTAANVSIRISDDGRGLNEEKILKKAREKGLISFDAKPSSAEIWQMIFLPGFSTAEKLTDVSGRGVGMDVVKRAVDELGGAISIESKFGHGTEFLINLPSTLSVLDAVVVKMSDRFYAVPVQDVEEVVDMSEIAVESVTQRGRMINLRGRLVPVERLSEYLPGRDNGARNPSGVALITRQQSILVAFEVDRVESQQSIVVRQLESRLAQVPGFVGGTILANGEPSMIINLPQIVKSYVATLKQ